MLAGICNGRKSIYLLNVYIFIPYNYQGLRLPYVINVYVTNTNSTMLNDTILAIQMELLKKY